MHKYEYKFTHRGIDFVSYPLIADTVINVEFDKSSYPEGWQIPATRPRCFIVPDRNGDKYGIQDYPKEFASPASALIGAADYLLEGVQDPEMLSRGRARMRRTKIARFYDLPENLGMVQKCLRKDIANIESKE